MLWRQAQQELKMHVEAGSKLVLIQIFVLWWYNSCECIFIHII